MKSSSDWKLSPVVTSVIKRYEGRIGGDEQISSRWATQGWNRDNYGASENTRKGGGTIEGSQMKSN